MPFKMRKALSWSAVVVIFALPLTSLPAVDMFLKIDGVDGESTDGDHKNEIDVLSWSFGMSQSASTHTGTSAGDGKVTVGDIFVTKWIDKASPVLMLHCANGDRFPKATLTVRKSGLKAPVEFLKIEMEKVIVSSISTGGSAGEDRLTENLSLNFAAFTVAYTPQRSDGTAEPKVEMGWDIANNVGK